MPSIDAFLMVGGCVFYLLAALGLLRFPDFYTRMQATAKAITLGVSLIAISVGIAHDDPRVWLRVVLLIGLVFVTSPVSAHALARAAYHRGITPWYGAAADDEVPEDELRTKTSASPPDGDSRASAESGRA